MLINWGIKAFWRVMYRLEMEWAAISAGCAAWADRMCDRINHLLMDEPEFEEDADNGTGELLRIAAEVLVVVNVIVWAMVGLGR